MAPHVSLFHPANIRAVLLVGETEWRPVTRMTESLVRISDKQGRAGLPGFRIEYPDGSSVGVTVAAVAGVRVGA